jgi:hypothetical protein
MKNKILNNLLINLQNSLIFLAIILSYGIYNFISFFSNKNFDEEFVYFFIVILVLFFSLKMFQDIFDFLIQTRTNMIFSQMSTIYNSNLQMIENLIFLEKDNIIFVLYLYDFLKKFLNKFFYFLFFSNESYILKFLFSLFLNLSMYKIFLFFKKSFYNIDKYHFFIKNNNFRLYFFNYIKDILMIISFFFSNKKKNKFFLKR